MNKKLLLSVLHAFIVLLSVFFLGILIPFLVLTVVVLFTDYTYAACILEPYFWIFALISWFVATIYINDEYSKT